MGFFDRHYERPGPGVDAAAPRKKGLARYLEITSRDFASLLKANLLWCVGCLLWGALVLLGILQGVMIYVLLGGLLGGYLAGPVIAGMYDTVLRTLRDEPNYWWHRYKKAYAANKNAAHIPGMAWGFITALQLWSLWLALQGAGNGVTLGLLLMGFLLVGFLLVGAYFNLLWCGLVVMDAPLTAVAKNAALLLISLLPRALFGGALQTVWMLFLCVLLPYSLPLYLVAGFWPVALGGCLAVYAPLEKMLDLENRIAAVQQAEREQAGNQTEQDKNDAT